MAWPPHSLPGLGANFARTPDRVRETLFNWLQATVPDARCLDLFAGSGALGLEALSRGARASVFVERLPPVAAAIRASLREVQDTRGRVVEQDVFAFLAGPPESFVLVFLDTPFAQGGLTELCKLLETRGWLAASASIYVEHSMRGAAPSLPAEWTLWREMRAGEVHAMLARRRALGAGRDQRMDET